MGWKSSRKNSRCNFEGYQLKFIFIFLILQINIVYANVYYVDKNNPKASDRNPGTKQLPWKTIKKAASIAKPGDIVFIRKGVYDVGNSEQWSVPAINPKHSGTFDKPIIFKAYPGDKVRIIGSPMPIGSHGRDYIIWDGFILGTEDGKKGGVIIFSAKGVIIQNCEIIGCYIPTSDNHDGIRVQNSDRIIIRNCKIHGIKGESWNSAGIKFYNVKNAIVENCEIYDCYTGIFDKEEGINNIYRKNIIHDIKPGPSIFIYTQDGFSTYGIKIYQNIIYNSGKVYITTDFPMEHKNIEIYNNIFYGTGISARRVVNLQIWNNIFYFTNLSINISKHVKFIYSDYNCFFPSTIFEIHKKRYFSLKTWQKFEGLDLMSFNKDPLFVNAKNYNFHLKKDSPCLNRGIDRQDFDNDGDMYEKINIGCYIKEDEVIGPSLN